MKAQIYSTQGAMAYQRGTSRVLVSKTGALTHQTKSGSDWKAGRNSYAHDLVDKVKAALRERSAA